MNSLVLNKRCVCWIEPRVTVWKRTNPSDLRIQRVRETCSITTLGQCSRRALVRMSSTFSKSVLAGTLFSSATRSRVEVKGKKRTTGGWWKGSLVSDEFRDAPIFKASVREISSDDEGYFAL